MLTSTYLVSTDKRLRAYLIGGLLAVVMAAGSVAYEVRSGDTLSAIASEHGVSLQALLDNNDISNPDLIRPGLRITIPGEGGGSGRVHVVAQGETLSDIAFRYKASLSGLVEANELSNPNLIRIGQKLTIPGGAVAGVAAPPALPPSTWSGPVTRSGRSRANTDCPCPSWRRPTGSPTRR